MQPVDIHEQIRYQKLIARIAKLVRAYHNGIGVSEEVATEIADMVILSLLPSTKSEDEPIRLLILKGNHRRDLKAVIQANWTSQEIQVEDSDDQ